MGEVGQKLDKQNFIETLQQQAQPIAISPSLPASTTGTSGLPVSFAAQTAQSAPLFPPAGSTTVVTAPFTGSSMYGREQVIAAPASTALPVSATTSTSYAFSSSNYVAPAAATASPLITAYGQPLSSTSVSVVDPASLQNHVFPALQPPRRMVHQQSWSEGTFENALQQTGVGNASGLVTAVPGFPHQFCRRRSMEQIAGLPQDYGMNSVIEPLDFKIPAAAVSQPEAERSREKRADSLQLEQRMKSPPREYSPVSQACDPLPPPLVSLSRECPASPPRPVTRLVDPTPGTLLSSMLSSPPQVADFPPATSCPVVDVPAPLVTGNDLVTDPPVTWTEAESAALLVTGNGSGPDPLLVSGVELKPTPLVTDNELEHAPPLIDGHVTVAPAQVCSDEVAAPVVTTPALVVAKSPPEAWVNPFSKLLKSFDDDVHDECSMPPLVSSVTLSDSCPIPDKPECDPVSATVPSVSPPPADREKRSSLTSDHSGTNRDHSPSRSNQAKSSPTSVAGDISPHRKGSGEGAATGKADERRSSLGSIPANFKARTGALLPSIPMQGRSVLAVREDRVCLRTGSLSEQEFVQQLNSSVGTMSSSGMDLTSEGNDSLNFEVDEEYEKEGEQGDEDEDEDEQAGSGGADKFTCDTIVEESEEESLSPRSIQNLAEVKNQTPCEPRVCIRNSAPGTTAPASRRTDGPRGSVIPLTVSRLSVDVMVVLVSLPSCVSSFLLLFVKDKKSKS